MVLPLMAEWAANGSYVFESDVFDLLDHCADAPVRLVYMDPPFATGAAQTTKKSAATYQDSWPSMDAYLAWLQPVLMETTDLLRPNDGVLAVHLDHRASADVKVWLDRRLGRDAFINEVVWCYSSGGASKRTFARKHDSILVYATGPTYRFDIQREPYPRDYGGRPGFHVDGRMLNDWWTIPILSTTAKERTGYPSQKPVELVARLIRAFTNPDDLVIDPCVGSGTTAVAAMQENRRFIVGDANPDAITSTIGRINQMMVPSPIV